MASTPMHANRPLEGGRRLAAMLALAGSVFMNVLDLTIANVSIPTIAGDLGASPTQGTWTITFFAIATAIMVPLTGWLAERIGQVRLFVLSTLAFTAASALCGFSGSLEGLIVARVLQGAAAGPMVPLSQTLLLRIYPPEMAARAMVAWTLPALAGPVLGPPLGGFITETFSWPWIFFINVPLGVIGASVTWALLRDRESSLSRKPVDVVGLALLVVWVTALQLMLDLGREQDWFNSREIVTLAIMAAVGFVFFVIWEWHDPHPVVDLTLFARDNFSFGVVMNGLGFGIYFSGVVLLSLWMQQTLGFSIMLAGALGAPPGLIAALMSPVLARLIQAFGSHLLLIVGFVAFAAANLLRSGFDPAVMPESIALAQVLLGIGVSLLFIPLNLLILQGLPQARLASASGLANFIRLLVMAAMTSAATTLWDYRASFHHSRLVEGVTPFNPALEHYIDQARTGGVPDTGAMALIERLIDQQAHTLAVDDYFWCCGLLFAVLLVPLGISWQRSRLSRPRST